MTITTAFVRSIHDDAPCPTWGRVLGWEDADRVAVAWGDAAYADDPWAEARIEFADELAVDASAHVHAVQVARVLAGRAS